MMEDGGWRKGRLNDGVPREAFGVRALGAVFLFRAVCSRVMHCRPVFHCFASVPFFPAPIRSRSKRA